MKPLFLILLFAFISTVGFGQNIQLPSVADSLKAELAKATHDTIRVLIYAKLVEAGTDVKLSRDEKIALGQKGYELARKIRFQKGIILCGNALGFMLVEKDYFKSLTILFDVKQICEFKKDTTNLALALGYIAYAYNKFDTPKALEYYRMCLPLIQKKHISERILPIYTAMGYAFKDKGDLDSGLVYLKKGYQFSLNGDSPISPNSYSTHFGEIYYKKGDTPLALRYLKEAIAHTEESIVGQAFYYLAQIYKGQNQLDSAQYFAKQSLYYEEKYGRSMHIIAASQLLYELYKNSNPKVALYYLEVSSATKDSLFSQEKARQVEKLDFEEHQREERNQRALEAHKAQFRNQAIIYALLFNLLGVLIFAYFLYRKNRQKHKTNQVLEKTLTELKTTQDQLIQSEKLASLGELTAGIAHEIQNPLNFVNNFSELSVELIEECPQPPEGAKEDWLPQEAPIGGWGLFFDDLRLNLEKINHHGKRASSIVKGMLEHSRQSTGERELTDINQLADEYLRLAYHGMKAKNESFVADYELIVDASLPLINVVPQDIGRVLLNLINNAFQSQSPLPAAADRPRGGTNYKKKVVVKTFKIEPNEKAPTGGLGASVTDNGAGIPADILPKIFQPFFTTKPTGEGTGLGLSLAYDIVTKGHGGTLEVESVEGEGTTFTVKLQV